MIVWVIHNAARASQVGRLIDQITAGAVATIRTTHPGRGEAPEPPHGRVQVPPREDGQPVRARTSGWIRLIDEAALLAGTPPGSTIELAVREGSFVLGGQLLAVLWPKVTDGDGRTPHEAYTIVDEPTRQDGLAYAINELVDIARRSIAPSSSDLTTARDAVLHLGVVVRELMLRDLPPMEWIDDDGRRLVRTQQLSFEDYCETSLGQVRDVVASSHELLTILLATIREISDQLTTHGLPDRRDLLHEHARLTLEQARQGLSLPHEVERVASRARAAGVDPDEVSEDDDTIRETDRPGR